MCRDAGDARGRRAGPYVPGSVPPHPISARSQSRAYRSRRVSAARQTSLSPRCPPHAPYPVSIRSTAAGVCHSRQLRSQCPIAGVSPKSTSSLVAPGLRERCNAVACPSLARARSRSRSSSRGVTGPPLLIHCCASMRKTLHQGPLVARRSTAPASKRQGRATALPLCLSLSRRNQVGSGSDSSPARPMDSRRARLSVLIHRAATRARCFAPTTPSPRPIEALARSDSSRSGSRSRQGRSLAAFGTDNARRSPLAIPTRRDLLPAGRSAELLTVKAVCSSTGRALQRKALATRVRLLACPLAAWLPSNSLPHDSNDSLRSVRRSALPWPRYFRFDNRASGAHAQSDSAPSPLRLASRLATEGRTSAPGRFRG